MPSLTFGREQWPVAPAASGEARRRQTSGAPLGACLVSSATQSLQPGVTAVQCRWLLLGPGSAAQSPEALSSDLVYLPGMRQVHTGS